MEMETGFQNKLRHYKCVLVWCQFMVMLFQHLYNVHLSVVQDHNDSGFF